MNERYRVAPAGPAERHAGPLTHSEDGARERLNLGSRAKRLRRLWRVMPRAPRCKMCNSPFGGPGGAVMRLIGKGRWPANPSYCGGCFKALYTHRAGAEIECTLLFADVRGSTHLAEAMRPSDYRRLIDRFYATASEILVGYDAIVDKFVGDEVIGIFIPALTETRHARQAIDAGLALLRASGHETDAPWIPIGIGVNTGLAYVGAVGTAEHVEFTALGDTVNVTARLASTAAAGEILVTEAAARAAELPDAGLEHRHLDLKGKSESTDVVALTLGHPPLGG